MTEPTAVICTPFPAKNLISGRQLALRGQDLDRRAVAHGGRNARWDALRPPSTPGGAATGPPPG
eukprot:2497542-Alexandrium_andersonii.AAC.1